MNDIKNKIDKIVSKDTSSWVENAEWHSQNEGWLKKSAKIALKILKTLKYKSMTQKDLALELGVSPQQISKIVKGKENLTLETIDKLEKILGVTLSETPGYKISIEFKNEFYYPGHLNMNKVASEIFNYNDIKEKTICSKPQAYPTLRLVS